MKTIYKYQLETTDQQKITLPFAAQILCVQTQNETPCLWALVESENTPDPYNTFYIYGTGHPIPGERANDLYIGTYQLQNGILVFHVFKEI